MRQQRKNRLVTNDNRLRIKWQEIDKPRNKDRLLLHILNIITAVEIFSPQWKYSHRGGNIITAVEILSPRWKYSHRGRNILTVVEILSLRWKYSHRGGNIITAVEILAPR